MKNKRQNTARDIIQPVTPEKIKSLIDTALGKAQADMVIAGADLVNVYSGELLRGYSVAIKADRIAYVGENAEHTVGPETKVIDAKGKTLIPGLIDAHTHFLLYTVEEFLKYAMKGGTTTIITETLGHAVPMGLSGVNQLLDSASNQPIKIFGTAPPMPNISPTAKLNAIQPRMLQRLLRQKRVLGLGETFWRPVLEGDERLLEIFTRTLTMGKTLEGHSAGARGNKLAAYIASGISSCHEPVTADEVMERVRLGLHTMIREGASRKDLEAIAVIKDEPIDFRRLVLVTDSVEPKYLMEKGYMESLVQKAVDLGFDPIVAIQMATLNAAEHFSLDSHVGGIAPGKCADMVLIPDLRTIRAEMVISNGQIIARKGGLLVPPAGYTYSKASLRSVRLPGKLGPADFRVPAEGDGAPVTIRVINLIAGTLTREEHINISPQNGFLEADIKEDLLKVAVIERASGQGNKFTGFIKGFGMKKGAIASSATTDLSGIVVIGTGDEDMAGAANRVFALQGGVVVYAGGQVLAELPLPIGGKISDLPLEMLCRKSDELQQRAEELGTPLQNVQISISALTTGAIPFFRICEAGLMDIRKGEIVGLTVS